MNTLRRFPASRPFRCGHAATKRNIYRFPQEKYLASGEVREYLVRRCVTCARRRNRERLARAA